MSQVVYRGNLKTASFPFLSELFGKSIIVKQQDQNSIRAIAPGQMEGDDLGIPQIYYCHNVVPTAQGYKAVQYDRIMVSAYDSTYGFEQAVDIRDGNGNSGKIGVDATGHVYILIDGASAWITGATPPTPALIAGKFMTSAFVSGTSYIYFSGVGCWIYNFATNTFTSTALTSLLAASVLGVVANRGYLIAYTALAVYWSSTTNATDFTPSLITGAGGGQVEGARGTIVSVGSVYGGFVIFTTKNAVAAIYSNNLRFPFNFIEVSGAGGINDPNFVSYDGNNPALYAYTTAGIQLITLRDATNSFSDVTDFLSGGTFEDFDESLLALQSVVVSGVVMKRLTLIGNRYLLISYGSTSLTHVLIFDLSLKQWGRLKLDHTDCFEYDRPNVETPKKSIAFLDAAGNISILNTDVGASEPLGVMVIGKFQYVRSRLLQLEKARIENINYGANFQLYDMPSTDGKNFNSSIVGYLLDKQSKYREYGFHNTAMNHSLVWLGDFHGISLELLFNVAGDR